MSGSVIERGETTIVDGMIYHDDKPVAWADADARAGRRLDRRKLWAFIEGNLCRPVSWTQSCSGCGYGFDPRGSGCSECGYHGVVRESMWVPTINAEVREPWATPDAAISHGECTLGVGCWEAGICYAAANGLPEQCPVSHGEGGGR